MRYLQVTATPDPGITPATFRTIADSEYVEETRLVEWNLGGGPALVALLRIDGDRDRVAAELTLAAEVQEVDCTSIDDDRFHALITLDTEAVPPIRTLFEALLALGIVVIKPIIYRDGQVEVTFVGASDALAAMLDSFPSAIDLTVNAVGEYRSGVGLGASALSERQRDAVRTALEVGYYEVPRAATHEVVADRLGCAPSTATEHLQKAEAKLVRGAMGAPEA